MFITYVLFFATCQSLSKEWISRRMVVENHKVLCSRYVEVCGVDRNQIPILCSIITLGPEPRRCDTPVWDCLVWDRLRGPPLSGAHHRR